MPLTTLYQWRYLGTGPTAYRVGRHLRYDPAAVQAWLHSTPADGRQYSGAQGALARLVRSGRGPCGSGRGRMIMERLLFTVRETAEMLGVSRSRVYELISTEQLASVKIGRSRRVSLTSIQRFMRRQRRDQASLTR